MGYKPLPFPEMDSYIPPGLPRKLRTGALVREMLVYKTTVHVHTITCTHTHVEYMNVDTCTCTFVHACVQINTYNVPCN